MITRHDAYDLSQRNTFGMKVSCAAYVEVTEPEDLLSLDFEALPQPVFVMGGGSNLLFVRDFPGTVLHMGDVTYRSERCGGTVLVTVGAGVVFDDFCARAAGEGLWGPENLSLIPGEAGASAVQNIGAYGVEAKDIIETVHAFDRRDRRFVDIPATDCAYGYRTSRFKTEWKGRFIITAVTYRLSVSPQPKLDYGGVRKALEARYPEVFTAVGTEERVSETLGLRPRPSQPAGWAPPSNEPRVAQVSDTQSSALTPQMVRDTVIAIRREKLPDPAETGSAGSFFCNPVISREHFDRIVETARQDNGPEYAVPHYEVDGRVKVPAAWMIEQCGFKGMRLGGAQVYPRQPLVIVNASGKASPEEVIALEERIICTVREKYGIELHPEVEHV